MTRQKITLFAIITLLNSITLFSQFSEDIYKESWEFNLNIKKTVKLETEEQGDKIYIYINNQSLYPYSVTIDVQLRNIKCSRVLPYKDVVYPGKTRAFTLEVKDKNLGYNYQTSYSYIMGNPNDNHKDGISYLIPLKDGSSIETFRIFNSLHSSVFKCEEGDTIYASRKGYVCNVPQNYIDNKYDDNVSITNNELEIYQPDGTIAIYKGISNDNLFIERCQTVFPGDPIGIAYGNSINIGVFSFTKEQNLKREEIKFCAEGKVMSLLRGGEQYVVTRPSEIVFNEMTRSQIKKYSKKYNIEYKKKTS